MIRSEEEYIDLAYRLYMRSCTKNGYIYQEPNKSLSGFVGKTKIVLKNINGALAVFVIDKQGHLHQQKEG
jgi:hypothetical protein